MIDKMGKNTTAQTQDIHVQEDLFEQILNGFNSSSKKGKKNKGTTLSTVQKQRTPLVAQSLLKDKRTNYFTNVWVKQLNPISIKVIGDIIKRIKESEEEIEESEDDQIEEEKSESDSSFSLLSAFRLYRFIVTFSKIVTVFNAVKQFNKEKLEPLTSSISSMQANKNMDSSVRKMFMLTQLRHFLYSSMTPVIGVLYSSITKFYNSPKIHQLFEEFENYMIKEAAKEAIISAAIWAIGLALSAPSLGGSTALAGVLQGMRYTYTAAKWAYRGYKVANTAVAIYDIVHFDDDDAKEWAQDINDFTDENIAPFVEQMNGLIDEAERRIYQGEQNLIDAAAEQFDVLSQASDIIGQAKRDIEVVNRVRLGLVRRARQESDGLDIWSGGYVQVANLKVNNSEQISIGMPETITFITHNETIYDEMLNRHSRMYNFRITQQSLDKLRDRSTGMFFCRLLNELNTIVYNHFGKVYQVFDQYSSEIDKQFPQQIENYKKSEVYSKIMNIKTDMDSVLDWLSTKVDVNIVQSIRNVGNRQSATQNNSNNQSQSSSSQQQPQAKYWRLSNRTLQPLTPKFVNGTLIGLDIQLIAPNDKVVNYKIDKFLDKFNWRATDSEFLLLDLYSNQRRSQWSKENHIAKITDHGVFANREEEAYTTYVKLFETLDENKDILYSRELKIEKETKELVDAIFEKITKEMSRVEITDQQQ